MAEVYDPSNPFGYYGNPPSEGGIDDVPWWARAGYTSDPSDMGPPLNPVDPSNPYDNTNPYPGGIASFGGMTGGMNYGSGALGAGITPVTFGSGNTITPGTDDSGLFNGVGFSGPVTDNYGPIGGSGGFGAGGGGTLSVSGPGASAGGGSPGGIFGTGVDFSLGGFGSLAGGLAGIGGIIAGMGPSQAPNTNAPTTAPGVLTGGTSPNSGIVQDMGPQEGGATTVPVLPPVVVPGGNSPNETNPPGGAGANSPNETNPPVTVPVVPPLPNPTQPSQPSTPTQPQTPTPVATTNPLDRDYYREGESGISALQRLSPNIFGLYKDASGNYGQQDFNNYSNLVGQVGNTNNYLTGQSILQTNLSNTGLRQGNLTDVQNMGNGYLQQKQQLNPELYANMNAMDARANAGIARNEYQNQLGGIFSAGPQYNQVNAQTGFDRANVAASDAGLNYAVNRLNSIGPSSIQQTLESQATNDLGLGRSLSPEQTRNAQEAARSAYAARGLGQSNSAMAAEVLNLDRAATERENARRTFAQGVDQTGFAQRNQSLNTALGLSGAAQGYAGLGLEAQRSNMQGQLQGNQLNLQGQMANQGAGLQAQQINNNLGMGLSQMDYGRQQQEFNNLNTAAQMRAATQFDPFATIIGQSTNNQGSNQQLFNQATGFTSGQLSNQYAANAFNPFNNYNADVSGSNFNAANARSIAAGNNAAAMAGAKDAATGQIAKSFLNLLYNVGGANNWWGS